MNAKVTLVGAGPGDAELLTLKALRAIEAAKVVVYDRLVSDAVMSLVPRGIPKIYAGKSCKHKAMPQEEINQLLVTLAAKYTHVVRLKGGDPFLFGRGGEEMLALARANIQCEIIPGITSAQGCTASVGIPLTHRGLASGVRFITGHRQDPLSCGAQSAGTGSHAARPDGDPAQPLRVSQDLVLNWESLADPDTTLVVYMGLVNIEAIAQNLVSHGLPASTPSAIIERGTTPEERIFTTNLQDLPAMVKAQNIQSPSLVVIGKVVTLAAVTKLSHDSLAPYAKIESK